MREKWVRRRTRLRRGAEKMKSGKEQGKDEISIELIKEGREKLKTKRSLNYLIDA